MALAGRASLRNWHQGRSIMGSEEEVEQSKGRELLQKPVSQAELSARVRKLLDGAQTRIQ